MSTVADAERSSTPRWRPRRKVKTFDLMVFCRHLSVFITAGVPMLDALDVIGTHTRSKTMRAAIDSISERLRNGESLPAAVNADADIYPQVFVNMLAPADVTGQLATLLDQAASYMKRDVESRRKVRSALAYPTIVLVLSVVSVTVLVTFVLPLFQSFFEEFQATLPLTTRMLISITDFFTNHGLALLIGFLAVVLVVVLLTGLGRGRELRDRVFLRLPIVGPVVRYAVVERFCRLLSSMVEVGVPLPDAVQLAAVGSGNRAFAAAVMGARQEMLQGDGFTEPLARTKMLPPAAIYMVKVGEETGTLEERLTEISDFYGDELEYGLKQLTNVLEPVLVIGVGILVGFVAVAVASALYGVYNSMKI